MAVEYHPGRVVGRADVAACATFAGLTLLTHAANFAFIIIGGRLLSPGDFGDLTAILGVVLIGLAPGMAVQSLTAAGLLGRPIVIDRRLAWRLSLAIGTVVAIVMIAVSTVLNLDSPTVVAAVAVAAAAIPLTAVNEGLLQGHGHFMVLGTVMASGAITKLGLGPVGLWSSPTLGVAALAIAGGYAVQAGLSRFQTRG
ncbi:MAG: hypothetical protein R3320_10295, partial [Nitriliruptorales bacterium]|nr:hypothetical protein [Nitriliruptorales bacterium]